MSIEGGSSLYRPSPPSPPPRRSSCFLYSDATSAADELDQAASIYGEPTGDEERDEARNAFLAVAIIDLMRRYPAVASEVRRRVR